MEQSPNADDDGFFNDLEQRPSLQTQNSGDGSDEPRAKRVACVLCRKRKLKCDGARPSCGTCSRLSHDCSYDDIRKKSGPRKGYVRSLESRLAQVEELLKTQDGQDKTIPGFAAQRSSAGRRTQQASPNTDSDWPDPNEHLAQQRPTGPTQFPNLQKTSWTDSTATTDAGYGLTSLGLEEAMPEQHIQEELDKLYFQKIHPVAPMIHPGRYYAGLKLAPQARPPICLRYAMWAMTASVTDQYEALQEHFYMRARKYLQLDEMRGHGECIVTLHHVQAWYHISMLEFKMTYFPRAWLSTGRASRLALMMGIHRLDGAGVDVKQCLPPVRDWTEREERRRTFWMVFTSDRFASIGTGWPMAIDEADIHTDLPAPDDAFESSREVPTIPFQKAFQPSGAADISSLGGVCLMACMFGRNLVHLHRGTPEDNEANLNGKFWLRHRNLDNTLLNIALSLPDHLRMPNGIGNQNTIFLNLCIHTSTICLHQAAIFKADSHKLPSHVAAESKIRCITSAAEVASIMRMISHMDLTNANPFAIFCLYVAARVFVQYLKSRPNDNNVKASLHFLLTAMQAMRRKNLLTESLLIQLDIDLQGADLEDLRSLRNRLSKMTDNSKVFGAADCGAGNTMPNMDSRTEQQAYTGGNQQSRPHENSYPAGIVAPLRTDSVSGPSPASTPHVDGADFSRVRFMPHRTKTPSTRPSPATVSDDVMDLTFDGTDGTSPASFAASSSRTSHMSHTPPSSVSQDVVNPLDKSGTIDVNNMTNEQFQAMMNDLSAENIFSGQNMGSYGTVLGNGPGDASFTLPNMALSPGPLDMGGSTGLTPLPAGDVTTMTSEELDQFIDAAAMDMGWERGFPGSTVTSENHSWRVDVSTAGDRR